jgi:hypothetical protein
MAVGWQKVYVEITVLTLGKLFSITRSTNNRRLSARMIGSEWWWFWCFCSSITFEKYAEKLMEEGKCKVFHSIAKRKCRETVFFMFLHFIEARNERCNMTWIILE